MARVSLEKTVFTDPRYRLLAAAAGISRWDAIARMAAVWDYCQEAETYVLSIEMLNILHDDIPNFSDAVMKSGLGRKDKHGVYICGTKGRIEWLANKRVTGRENGKLGGRPKGTGDEPDKNLDRLREETPPALASSFASSLEPKEKEESKSKSLVPAALKPAKKTPQQLVEELTLAGPQLDWCAVKAPKINPDEELEAFKIRMRAVGYVVGKSPVKDAWAAFQHWMSNAQKWHKENASGGRPGTARSTETAAPAKKRLTSADFGAVYASDIIEEERLRTLQPATHGGSNDPV